MKHPVFENVINLTFMAQKSMTKARGSGYGKEGPIIISLDSLVQQLQSFFIRKDTLSVLLNS